MLYHIVAMAKNRVIGKDNRLPWHFPEDLKHFKRRTTGQTVIMGRKTYDSIGKPLPNRENFVLTRNAEIATPPPGARNDVIAREQSDRSNLRFFNSIGDALGAFKTPDAYIIGGAQLFEQTMAMVDGIYLTRIDQDFEGDTHYPEIPEIFEEVEIERLQENPQIDVVYYERKPDDALKSSGEAGVKIND